MGWGFEDAAPQPEPPPWNGPERLVPRQRRGLRWFLYALGLIAMVAVAIALGILGWLMMP
jgi:hypothetical protein